MKKDIEIALWISGIVTVLIPSLFLVAEGLTATSNAILLISSLGVITILFALLWNVLRRNIRYKEASKD